MTVRILVGDCVEHMPQLDAASIDSVVTDPPYGLKFMGKDWDHGIPGVPFWTEALRVLKPGGHLLAFGGTRTYHRLAVAIEDAGFEIRDCLMWLYGSGFPKSHDVSKAIDKAAGAEREIVRVRTDGNKGGGARTYDDDAYQWDKPFAETEPATDLAKQWDGWGTALKPAWEPIILARKPLAGTVAANVEQHGTGAINVDGCRIGTDTVTINAFDDGAKPFGDGAGHPYTSRKSTGRWPANVILDADAAAMLDAQSGERTSGAMRSEVAGYPGESVTGFVRGVSGPHNQHGDTGGASRFFYTAKASSAERNQGLAGMQAEYTERDNGFSAKISNTNRPRANHHPTVKPLDLMQWLCRLVTPPGGLVLDPFMGSGSTLIAADREGFNAIGMELDPEYAEIARRRLYADCPLFVEVA